MSTHIVFLAETEEATNLGRTLWTQALRVHSVREAWNVGVALLHDGEGEDGQVHGDDASANRLSLALTSATWAVAAVAVGEEKANTGWVHDTLLHREALLVVSAGDSEDVAFEFVANGVSRNFVAHASIHEDTKLALIFDFDELLGAVGRVGDVELHLCSSAGCCSELQNPEKGRTRFDGSALGKSDAGKPGPTRPLPTLNREERAREPRS